VRARTEREHELLRSYAMTMGVDAGLIDAAAKTSADQIHWMSRAEIDRYGVETRGFYETRWAAIQESALLYSVSKSWTQAESGGGFRTSLIRLRCINPHGYLLYYQSEQPLFRDKERVQVMLSGNGVNLQLDRAFGQAGVSSSYATTDPDTVERIATAARLAIVEKRGATDTGTFELSTAGLVAALAQFRKRCIDNGQAAPPAAMRTQ
jgi:hypothetical protein